MASGEAESVGRLVVSPVGGVELASGAEAVTLPIEVLQSVSLSFDPADVVEIERGRSTEFEVAITPSLVADRKTTVTLVISGEGFSFAAGRTQPETIVFDVGKSREPVAVETTAPIGMMAPVSVSVTRSSGVAAMDLPGLSLRSTPPRVVVAFSPAAELRLPSGGTTPVTLSLADYSLTGDQAIELRVSAEGEGLEVFPSECDA